MTDRTFHYKMAKVFALNQAKVAGLSASCKNARSADEQLVNQNT